MQQGSGQKGNPGFTQRTTKSTIPSARMAAGAGRRECFHFIEPAGILR